MGSYAILRRCGWESPRELSAATERARRIGDEQMPGRIRWIRTYALAEEDGRYGALCIYQAEGPDAIRAHAARAFMPVDEIVAISGTVEGRERK